MEKLTKRKAFNFLRSYFDVVNELQSDSDKLSFLMSIIDKQFLDEDPKELSFLVKLCYSSQKHAIESSVKGWKRVSSTDMQGNLLTNPPTNLLTNPPTNLLTNPKEVEEKEKDKEKEEVKDIKAALPFQFMKSLLDLGADKDLVTDWIKVRKNKKATNSETAFNGFKNQLDISGLNIDKVLRECIEKSWSGFKAEWMTNNNTNNKKEQQYELTQFTNRLRGLD